MKKDNGAPINRLLRGVATNHVETIRDAWRDLLNDREAAVPIVRGKLTSPAWEGVPRGPSVRYLGVLLALLDELDADAFRQEIDRLLAGRLHSLHRKTVEILSRRGHEKPVMHIGPNIPVYVASDVADHGVVIGNLLRWSRTPQLDLEGVTRVDVIARHPQLDYLGKYNVFFSGIILTWPAHSARGLRLWWQRLDAEFTFYHEVGHHACDHAEGGQVAEQEDEADAYARSMMQRSRPVFTGIARALLLPLKPLVRRLVSTPVDATGKAPERA